MSWGNGGGYGANNWGISERGQQGGYGGGGPQRRGDRDRGGRGDRDRRGGGGGGGGGFNSGGYGSYTGGMGGGGGNGFGGGPNFGSFGGGGGNFVNGPQIPTSDMDPMVEKLSVEYSGSEETATEASAVVNSNQLICIIGRDGKRLEELKNISSANIKYELVCEDSCLTNIMISQGVSGGSSSVRNAVWLMNICLNAFCPPNVSLAPFDPRRPLEEVVVSQRYGAPPGLGNAPVQQGQTVGGGNAQSW